MNTGKTLIRTHGISLLGIVFFLIMNGAHAQTVGVTRALPSEYTPGQQLQVTLNLTVDPNTAPFSVIVTEHYPEGWTFVSASPAPNQNNAADHELKWFFFQASGVPSQTITYVLAAGTKTFSGMAAHADAQDNIITENAGGDSTVNHSSVPTNTPIPSPTPLPEQGARLVIGSASGSPGDQVSIDISLESPANIDSYGFSLHYNSSLLTYVRSEKEGSKTSDWLVSQANDAGSGLLWIGGVSGNGTPITTDGVIIRIVFQINSDASGTIGLTADNFVNGLIGILGVDGTITVGTPNVSTPTNIPTSLPTPIPTGGSTPTFTPTHIVTVYPPTSTPTQFSTLTPIPTTGDENQLTPIQVFTLNESTIAETGFIEVHGGLDTTAGYPPAMLHLGNVPTGGAFEGATDGMGMSCVIAPGQVHAILGPPIDVAGRPALMRLSVTSVGGGSAMVFAGLLPAENGVPDGSMGLLQSVSTTKFAGRWTRLWCGTTPENPATQVFPFIQFANLGEAGSTIVYLDQIEIYALQRGQAIPAELLENGQN